MHICIHKITRFIRVKSVCKFVIEQGTCLVMNSSAKVLPICQSDKCTPYANAIFITLKISTIQNTPYTNPLTKAD